MGKLYRASCPLCGYEEEFPLGGGLLSANLLQCMRALPKEEQEQVKKLHDCGEVLHFSAEQKLTRCIHCHSFGQLNARLMIEITDGEQQHHVFGNRCDHCNHKLEVYEAEQLLTENTKASLCPSCGKKALSFQTVGFWD